MSTSQEFRFMSGNFRGSLKTINFNHQFLKKYQQRWRQYPATNCLNCLHCLHYLICLHCLLCLHCLVDSVYTIHMYCYMNRTPWNINTACDAYTMVTYITVRSEQHYDNMAQLPWLRSKRQDGVERLMEWILEHLLCQ